MVKRKLLYLEDDQALASVTSRALAKRGFDVVHVADLDQAGRVLGEHRFASALLDLKIGNTTSLDLLQKITERGISPAVVLTGYGTIRAAVQAIKLGAVDFLSKPCSIAEIIAALEPSGTEAVDMTSADIAPPSLKNTEWEAIQKALDDNNGNVSAAARQLKLHRRTLQRKLQKKHSEPGS